MKTLKRRFEEIQLHIKLDTKNILNLKDMDEDYLNAVKEWLEEKHQWLTHSIQYEEMFPSEVIPDLLTEFVRSEEK